MEKDPSHIPFLGTGWSFPPVFNKVMAKIETRKGNNDIMESLQILLTTVPGERITDPDYGCDLSELLFENMSMSLQTTLSEKIRRSIVEYEPRVTLEHVDFEPELDKGLINIRIEYTIRSTNSRTNMVFPFYLQEGTNL